MKIILQLLLIVVLPLYGFSQIEIHQGTALANQQLIPFYTDAIIQNATIKSFQATITPAVKNYGPPANAIIVPQDSTIDDTTYDVNPILDYGKIVPSNTTVNDGLWQTTKGGSVWTLKIDLANAYNTSLHFENFQLSSTASMYISNGDFTIVKGPYTKDAMINISTFGTFPLDGSICYVMLYEPNNANIIQNNFTISAVVFGYQPIGDFQPPITNPSIERSHTIDCIPSIRCNTDWMSMAQGVSRWSGQRL